MTSLQQDPFYPIKLSQSASDLGRHASKTTRSYARRPLPCAQVYPVLSSNSSINSPSGPRKKATRTGPRPQKNGLGFHAGLLGVFPRNFLKQGRLSLRKGEGESEGLF
jgi:hypothetical protein